MEKWVFTKRRQNNLKKARRIWKGMTTLERMMARKKWF